MTKDELIAKSAEEIKDILTKRGDNYADPRINFNRIADYWTVDFDDILKPGAKVTRTHVAQAMISVKKARITHKYTHDSMIDGLGYFLCMAVGEELSDIQVQSFPEGVHFAGETRLNKNVPPEWINDSGIGYTPKRED